MHGKVFIEEETTEERPEGALGSLVGIRGRIVRQRTQLSLLYLLTLSCLSCVGHTWSIACCAQVFLKPVRRRSTNWTQALLPTFQNPRSYWLVTKQPSPSPIFVFCQTTSFGVSFVQSHSFGEMGPSTRQEGNCD